MNKFIPKVLESSPQYEDRINLGFSLLRERRFDEALAEFLDILKLAPENTYIYIVVGQIYARRREYHLALDYFYTTMKLDPFLPQAPMAAAQLHLKMKDLTQAQEQFQTVLSLDPKSELAYIGLSQVKVQREQFAAAIEDLQQAINLNPQSLMARLLLVEAYRRQGTIAVALEELHKTLEINPHVALVHLQLGRLYQQQGDLSKARAAFQYVRVLSPGLLTANPWTQLEFAETLLADDHLQEVSEVLEQTPNFAQLARRKHLVQGDLYRRQGQTNLAVAEYQAALHLSKASDGERPFTPLELPEDAEDKQWQSIAETYRAELVDSLSHLPDINLSDRLF